MASSHISFVLMAEFDEDLGPILNYQFPQPLGTDEPLLASLMLPDGAEKRTEDWSIFMLNQTRFNTISPVLALDSTPEHGEGHEEHPTRPEMLFVISLVCTRKDPLKKRGAAVKAMAICTRHPYIHIFKPILLISLDDYYANPSQDCLARLFDAVNAMDFSVVPVLSRDEKFIMRASERKDVFVEKFTQLMADVDTPHALQPSAPTHRPSNSAGSYSSFEEGILQRKREKERLQQQEGGRRNRAGTESTVAPSYAPAARGYPVHQSAPSESSFTLGGSAVWVGDESELDGSSMGGSTLASSARQSIDTSSSSSHDTHGKHQTPTTATHQMANNLKDTHFYHTMINYKAFSIPIKIPLFTFPEEVGDYSLVQLVQAFSRPSVVVSGPQHPHLHTSGPQTHPIIILFNALITGKRVLFVGHDRPAGTVTSYVLSACALASGCGAVMRGYISRSFPYATLNNREEWESTPGYIAGVTNPLYETSDSWDLLLDIGSGRVIVSKNIHTTCPVVPVPAMGGAPLVSRSGSFKTEAPALNEGDGKDASQRADAANRESVDNQFMEDIISAITLHFGEGLVRMRFTEYVMRFLRLASRYEEEVYGSTKLGYPRATFSEGLSRLGSGIMFGDEAKGRAELQANASRIEAWRKTESYQHAVTDFRKAQTTNTIKSFDLGHQVHRMRYSKNLPDGEVELIMRNLVVNVKSYEQVVELLAWLTPHGGGLLHLGFGLFHPSEVIRNLTVELFDEIRNHPIGVIFLQQLNHFQRYAYVRQAHARELLMNKEG